MNTAYSGNLTDQNFDMDIETREHFCNSYRKKKRFRSAFTTDQINGLEKEYKKFPYVGIVTRKIIARSLNIPERAVKIWFQNRRMKEKKDKGNNNFDEYTAINLVNDQATNTTATLSSNDAVTNSISPQTISKTGLDGVNNYSVRNSNKYIDNITLIDTTDKKNDTDKEAPTKPLFFQNNTVTSSTNDIKNIGPVQIELMKKYRNDLHSAEETNRQKVRMRRDGADNCKSIQSNRETSQSSMHRRSTTQVPVGCFTPYSQSTKNFYQPTCLPVGNILWKPIDSNMANVSQLNQFALMPNPHTVPNSMLQNTDTQQAKCFCNCHKINPQETTSYVQDNHVPPPQFIFAVPYHNALQYPYQI